MTKATGSCSAASYWVASEREGTSLGRRQSSAARREPVGGQGSTVGRPFRPARVPATARYHDRVMNDIRSCS